MQRIHARSSVSISDLKKNPSGVISQSKGEPVVILNHMWVGDRFGIRTCFGTCS